jgi:cell division protein FtsB
MNILRFRRYDLLVCLACLALLSSFAWYAAKGPRGYNYQASLEQQIDELNAENIKLADEKASLEKQVRLVRPESVDRDMLEQLARTELKMTHPSSLVVLQNNENTQTE